MKVVELLPFFNEVDILKARCQLTSLVVDRVLVVEGNRTHQGEPKESVREWLPLDEGSRWEEWPPLDKRIAWGLASLPNGEGDDANWARERAQRDYLLHGLEDLAPDDLILSCDLDEIVVPYAMGRIAEATLSGPVRLGMRMIYYGTREDPRGWGAAKAFRVKDAPESLSELRLRGGLPLVPLVGWHLSYIGDAARRRTKVEAFAHAENRPGTSAWERIAAALDGPNGEALVDFDPNELPATLRQLVDDAS